MESAWLYTLVPATAAVVGTGIAAVRQPSRALASALQHLAAGVLFAAIAGEILPDLKHQSPVAVVAGGAFGIGAMTFVKHLGTRAVGAAGLITMLGIDILVDGLVLGLGFVAGAKQGILLVAALTLEILFLGLAVTGELVEKLGSKGKVIATVSGLSLLLPIGALLGGPVGGLPDPYVAAFFAFSLVALLYLVTEELLVEAHEVPESSWTTALFFVGFLGMFLVEEALG